MKISDPGLLSVVQAHDYGVYVGRGYKWISFQHWNRGARGPMDQPGDYSFTAARNAGLEAGVWGVLYEDEDAGRFSIARDMARRAVDLGASHLMFDIEYTTTAQPVIDGAREGGWTKPIHLTCLGAPDKRDATTFWDYNYDLQSFLSTGGGIFPQAYANQHSGYAPKLTLDYYAGQLGVPRDRLNLMIWPNGQGLTGAQWVQLLLEAGLGKALSIFLAETTSSADYDALAQLTLSTAVVAEDVRLKMIALAQSMVDEWKRQGKTDAVINNQRIGLALALLNKPQTDPDWAACRDAIKAALKL